MNGPKCEYSAYRGQKLLHCSYTATQTVSLGDETLRLCPTHAMLITKLLARKDKAERSYKQAIYEIETETVKIITAVHDMRSRQ